MAILSASLDPLVALDPAGHIEGAGRARRRAAPRRPGSARRPAPRAADRPAQGPALAGRRPGRRADAELPARAAGWPLRSLAFGVGPLPSRPRRLLAAGAHRRALLAAGLADGAPAPELPGPETGHLRRPDSDHRAPSGGVLDDDAGRGEPYPDGVGGGEVTGRAGRGPRSSSARTSTSSAARSASSSLPGPPVHCGSSGSTPSTPSWRARARGVARRRPCRRRRARCCRRAPSRGRRRARRRRSEVVVHRRDERLGARVDRVAGRAGEQLGGPLHEALDALERGGRGLVAAPRRILDGRPVVRARRGSSAARPGGRPLAAPRRRERVAERLAHLLAAEVDPAVVQPVAARSRRRPPRDCASSFSWCGKRRSIPPPWMSNSAPR